MRVCGFIGERYEPAMLSERGAKVPVAGTAASGWGDWRERHHAATVAPVTAGFNEKWRAELTDAEIAVIEGVCGPVMDAVGYRPARDRVARAAGRLAAAAIADDAPASA